MIQTAFRVDRELLERYRVRRRPPAGLRAVLWFIRRWILFAVGFYLLAVVGAAFLDGQMSRAFELSGRGIWRNVLVPVVCGLTINLLTVASILLNARKSADVVAAEIENEWGDLERPNWPLHALLMGLLMGVGVGVPVGALLAFGPPTSEQPTGGPIWAWVNFIGLTLLWTIPIAFLRRWGTLWRYRRLGQSNVAT